MWLEIALILGISLSACQSWDKSVNATNTAVLASKQTPATYTVIPIGSPTANVTHEPIINSSKPNSTVVSAAVPAQIANANGTLRNTLLGGVLLLLVVIIALLTREWWRTTDLYQPNDTSPQTIK